MARIEFNWSTLTRKDTTDSIYSLSPKIVNQELEILEFHKLIKNHLKKHFPVIVSKKFDKKIPFNRVFVGGTYYSDYDQENKQCIEIVFVYNSSFPYLKMSTRRFKHICLSIADTLLHEIIHMRQHRRREFKILPEYASNVEKTEKRQEQGYLGCSDEIDAYGFNIACEMHSKFNGKQSTIVKHLSKNLRSCKKRNDTWKMYLRAFDYNHNHIIIKRLKKKIIRYLPYAEIGKPYRNRDWINW
jgi:hypothetical protein